MTTKTKHDYDSTEEMVEATADRKYGEWAVKIKNIQSTDITQRWLQEKMESMDGVMCYKVYTYYEHRGSHTMHVVIDKDYRNAYIDWHSERLSVPGAGTIDDVLEEVFNGEKGTEDVRVYRFRPEGYSSAIIFAKWEAFAIGDYMHDGEDGEKYIIEADSMPRLELHALPEFEGY